MQVAISAGRPRPNKHRAQRIAGLYAILASLASIALHAQTATGQVRVTIVSTSEQRLVSDATIDLVRPGAPDTESQVMSTGSGVVDLPTSLGVGIVTIRAAGYATKRLRWPPGTSSLR
jgi:hypothetical protein